MWAIETKNLTKTYCTQFKKKITVVNQLNLNVEQGEIFGFLGPNGAGKTTTIKMLLGIIHPSSGSAKILGKDAWNVKGHQYISYLPEKPYYYEHMTGFEVIKFYASLFGIKNHQLCHDLLAKVGLTNDAYKPLAQYSKGMQQRVGIAQCLLNNPKLLFLDEPTSGLDPVAHIEIQDLILKLKEEGKTIFISSHALSDIEKLCDRVAIINHGKIQKQGYLNELLVGNNIEIIANNVPELIAEKLRTIPNSQLFYQSKRVILEVSTQEDINSVVDILRSAKVSIDSITQRRKKLEDLFLEAIDYEASKQKATV